MMAKRTLTIRLDLEDSEYLQSFMSRHSHATASKALLSAMRYSDEYSQLRSEAVEELQAAKMEICTLRNILSGLEEYIAPALEKIRQKDLF